MTQSEDASVRTVVVAVAANLLVAAGIFVIGGLLAIADGVQSLRHPEPLTNGALLIDEAAPADVRERLRQGVGSPVPTCSVVSVGCATGCCRCRRSPRWRSRRSGGGSVGSHRPRPGGAVGG